MLSSMRAAASFALLATLLLLASCTTEKLSPIPLDGLILAFGDSLTEGTGTNRENSYPAVLEALSSRTVINAGVSGETTDEGRVRLPEILDRHSPALVVLIEGGNDILRNLGKVRIKQNLRAMIEMIHSRGSQVVLIGVPEKNLFTRSAPFYQELAEEFDLVHDVEFIGDLLRSPSLKSDRVHFNAKGYRKMAESIHELLQENGALP